jgi:hypothetical protein
MKKDSAADWKNKWSDRSKRSSSKTLSSVKLLPHTLLKRFAEIGSVVNPNPLVIARYIEGVNRWEWYATNYYPDKRMFYGWMSGSETEMGYFSLDELVSLDMLGFMMVRDPNWVEKRLSEVKAYEEA